MSIAGNMIGSYSQIGKTFIITDEDGVEYTGVVTDQETIFTANAATDIREGTVAATDEGVVTGTKVIPNYETTQASLVIMPGENCSIPLAERNNYNYTKFQCIVTTYNSSISDSVAAHKISLENQVFEVNSSTALSNVTKNTNTKSIDLNIVNNTENPYVIFYFTYRED